MPLMKYRPYRPLVLAIPRGGVPIGMHLAKALGADFDLVMVRKLRSAYSTETAIGAVDEAGNCYFPRGEGALHARDADAEDRAYIEQERTAQMALIAHRRTAWGSLLPMVCREGRTVIVVDDGLATGYTMICALKNTRAAKPARLVCAVPVGSMDARDDVARYADELVCLEWPSSFFSVSENYQHFPQLSDADVVRYLQKNRSRMDRGMNPSHGQQIAKHNQQ